QNRTQTDERLLAVDPKTGATHELLREQDAAWVNIERPFPLWRKDGSAFFWYTERNGGPEVELRKASGEKLSTWVPPAANFGQLAGFDEASGWLYFTTQPTQPVHVLSRVREGGKVEEVATGHTGPRMQGATVSKNGSHLVVMTSALDAMPVWAGLDQGGQKLGTLPSLAEKPPFLPRVELRKVGEGEGFWS